MPRRALRSQVGMVLPQDTWLFQGTIRDNIAYGRPDASDADIQAAAEATYVDRFVAHLPEGYDAPSWTTRSSNVSAGEKQLITIARAFLSQPSLLILDEALRRWTPGPSCSCNRRWPRCAPIVRAS